jgi:hypothetical protein
MADGIGPIGNLLGTVNSANALKVTLDGGTASATLFLAGDGTVAAASYSFTDDPNTGIFSRSNDHLSFAVGGVLYVEFPAGEIRLAANVLLGWNATTNDAGDSIQDVILGREAAAVLQMGADAAGVTNQMFKGPDRITSDGVGGNLTFAGGRNRGASAGGSILFQTSPAAGAGNTGTLATALTIDSTALATFVGQITTAAGTTAIAPLLVTNGTNLTTATANAIENDGAAFYKTQDTTNGRTYIDGWNYFRLTGSGSGITTIADFFGSTDGIPLVASGVYEIEWHCYFSQATAGTATWTVVTATTNLANITGEYVGSNIAGIGTVGAPQTAAINTTNSSSTAFPVTGTEADAVTHYFQIRVLVTAGAGSSNTRLRLTMGAGTATPLINSYFRVRRLSGANVGAFVA